MLLLCWLLAPAALAHVAGVSLLEAPAEGERPLPPPDQIEEAPLVGDAPAPPGAEGAQAGPEEDLNKALEPEALSPLAAAIGGVAGGLVGVTAGLLATSTMIGVALGVVLFAPFSVPLILGVGAAALISVTLIPAFAGTGAGIGALLSQGSFDFINIMSVLVFIAATYVTVAVVLMAIAAAVALLALLVASPGATSCAGCSNCTCPSAATASSAQAGPGCAQASVLPPYFAVQMFLGKEPSTLMVFPTLGGMVGSLAGGAAVAAMLGLGAWAAGAATLGPEDPNLPAIAIGAGIGGFVVGNILGAVIGGGVAALAATAPSPSLEELRGKRADDDEFQLFDDRDNGYPTH